MDENTLRKEMGLRIEKIRKDMGKTKTEFAKELDITPQFMGIIEKGDSVLSYEKLYVLSRITGYSADYIIYGKDDKMEEKVEKLLEGFSYEEIQKACEIIKQIAMFMKKQ